MILLPGEDVADRFTVEEIVGRGGMAAVYRVRHKQLGSLHALKLLHVNRPSLVRRVLLEGRIQASLRHPNIIAVTDVVEYRGGLGLVMEYVDSASLQGWLDEHGPFSVEEALSLLAPILAGVVAAHDNDVLHRDLKPANVLLARSAGGVVPKVTDFGIAKMLADEVQGGGTIAGTPMGTPGYMAPEQVTDSSKADKRADIFALGAMLYALLCGEPPFVEDETDDVLRRTVQGEWVRLRDRLPGVPAAVDLAVEKAMATRPDDRFPDARSLGRALFADQPALLALVPPKASPDDPLRVNHTGSGVASMRPPSLGGSLGTPAPRTPETYAGEGGFEAPSPAPRAPVVAPTVAPDPPPLATLSSPGTLDPPRRGPRALVIAGAVAALGVALVAAGVAGLGAAYGLGAFEAAPEPAAVVAAEPDPVAVGAAATPTAAAEPAVTSGAPAAPDAVAAPGAATGPAAPAATTATTAAPITRAPATATAAPTATATAPAPTSALAAEPEPAPDEATPEPQPEVVAAPPAEPAAATPALPRVVGTFVGTANNRPFTMRLTRQDGARISGEIEFALGATRRVATASGTVGADGSFVLEEAGGEALRFEGRVDRGAIAGSYRKENGKALSFSVKMQP